MPGFPCRMACHQGIGGARQSSQPEIGICKPGWSICEALICSLFEERTRSPETMLRICPGLQVTPAVLPRSRIQPGQARCRLGKTMPETWQTVPGDDAHLSGLQVTSRPSCGRRSPGRARAPRVMWRVSSAPDPAGSETVFVVIAEGDSFCQAGIASFWNLPAGWRR